MRSHQRHELSQYHRQKLEAANEQKSVILGLACKYVRMRKVP